MFKIHVNTILDFFDFFGSPRTSLRVKDGWLSAWETRVGHVPENRSCQSKSVLCLEKEISWKSEALDFRVCYLKRRICESLRPEDPY